MASIGKIARRTFLVGTAAIAGGVVFGVYKLNQDPPNPLKPGEGEWPLNAFVVITTDGVTVICPKSEFGQGVHSTWAALVAEELDVDWQQIRVVHSPAALAYYNAGLFGMALPGLDYRRGPVAEGIAAFMGKAAKLLDLDVTGGSSSIRDGYTRLRIAGATARETLKLALSRETGTPVSQMTTEGGHVVLGDGTRVSYATIAPLAADVDPPRVGLRDPSTWRYLGRDMPRLDMVAKVTGTAEFGIDVRLEGMKYATVHMSPRRGKMVGFDKSKAQSMPGVERIIDLGDGFAVVASNTWLAFKAAEAVEPEWGPAPYPADTASLWAKVAEGFDAEPHVVARDEGNADRTQDGTEVIAEYRAPYLAHTTMEPMNATALFKDGKLTVWAGVQTMAITRDNCAAALGIAAEDVTVIVPFLGGGFGRRATPDYVVQAARIAKEMAGTPIKLTWTREEDVARDHFRPAAMARMRGVVRDGKAVLYDAHVASASITLDAMEASGGGAPMKDKELVGGMHDQPYAIPNFRVAAYRTFTGVPTASWRSVGASYGGFFFDTFIDEMAHAAGADPLAFRLDLIRPEHEPSAKLLETVAEMSGWGSALPQGTAQGVAFTYSFGTPVAQVIQVSQRGSGIGIDKVWIACDPGVALDPRNIEAQMFGGCLYGLSAAVMGEITFADGRAEQSNFWDYDALRMHNAPAFEVRILQNAIGLSGVGEPGTPPAAPALGNALFALTGTRARELPLIKTFDLIL